MSALGHPTLPDEASWIDALHLSRAAWRASGRGVRPGRWAAFSAGSAAGVAARGSTVGRTPRRGLALAARASRADRAGRRRSPPLGESRADGAALRLRA